MRASVGQPHQCVGRDASAASAAIPDPAGEAHLAVDPVRKGTSANGCRNSVLPSSLASARPASANPLRRPKSRATERQIGGDTLAPEGVCYSAPAAAFRRRPFRARSRAAFRRLRGGPRTPPAAPSVSVKPEKASPLAPPGLGAAPGHPGRASLTGPVGAAGACQRPTPQRRSLFDRNRGTMATESHPTDLLRTPEQLLDRYGPGTKLRGCSSMEL